RLDSPGGRLLGTAQVPATGDVRTYATVTAPLAVASGRHDVFLVFHGSFRISTFPGDLSTRPPPRPRAVARPTLPPFSLWGPVMRALPLPSFLRWAIVSCLVALLAPAAARAQTLPPAQDVFNQITVGWNLGNSMESLPNETGFGNPVVTQQVIDAVKRAGFNA